MNSEERLIKVFFYGAYMDPDILFQKGVNPRSPEKVTVSGYKLKIGNMATLLRDASAKVSGMMYDLTHKELYDLYEGSGLDAYVREPVLAVTEGSESVPALCCNLLIPPLKEEFNESYYQTLREITMKLSIPLFDY